MVQIWIPSLMRDLTAGKDRVSTYGGTVKECLENLETTYPGIMARLCNGDQLIPEINIAVDGKISRQGLKARVNAGSEIHFVPALAGG